MLDLITSSLYNHTPKDCYESTWTLSAPYEIYGTRHIQKYCEVQFNLFTKQLQYKYIHLRHTVTEMGHPDKLSEAWECRGPDTKQIVFHIYSTFANTSSFEKVHVWYSNIYNLITGTDLSTIQKKKMIKRSADQVKLNCHHMIMQIQ